MKKNMLILILFELFCAKLNSATAQAGNAAQFSGANSNYISIADQPSLDFAPALTVEAWIKHFNVNTRQVLISKTASGDNTWMIEFNPVDFDRKLNFWLNVSGNARGGGNMGGNSSPVAGQWYHFACVYNGSNKQIYVNGVLDQSVFEPGVIFTNTQPVIIGNWINNNRSFAGLMDEVRIWNIARTQDEIRSTMNGPLTGGEPGLIVYFDMNRSGQGAGLVVTNRAAIGASLDGLTVGTGIVFVPSDVPLAVEERKEARPESYMLFQNYPNPFNPETTIKLALPRSENVMIRIYNLLGQHVRTLFERHMTAGYSEIVWDGKDEQHRVVPSGVYLVRMQAGEFSATRKVVVMQ